MDGTGSQEDAALSLSDGGPLRRVRGVSLCERLAGVLGHYGGHTRPRLRIGERPREVAQEGSTG